MRRRTIILILSGVLLLNALIGVSLWLWLRGVRPPVSTSEEADTGLDGAARRPRQNDTAPAASPIVPVTEPVPAGSHLILVVQTGRVLSPKIPPVDVDGANWTGNCNEYGVAAGGAFTLCLFLVSEEGLREIADWHAQGKATRSYPPFRAVPGGALLAQSKLRVAR